MKHTLKNRIIVSIYRHISHGQIVDSNQLLTNLSIYHCKILDIAQLILVITSVLSNQLKLVNQPQLNISVYITESICIMDFQLYYYQENIFSFLITLHSNKVGKSEHNLMKINKFKVKNYKTLSMRV